MKDRGGNGSDEVDRSRGLGLVGHKCDSLVMNQYRG